MATQTSALSRRTSLVVNTGKYNPYKGPIVWLDVETTSDDVHKAQVLEIAVVITDQWLNKADPKGVQYVIQRDVDTLQNMHPVCLDMHTKSGLVDACKKSQHSKDFVENAVLRYIQKWVPKKGFAFLGGNSVHFDRFILMREMPSIINYLHYRNVDVSVLMFECRALFPDCAPSIYGNHRAMSDVLASIQPELEYFREHCYRTPQAVHDSVHGCGQRAEGASRSSKAQQSILSATPALAVDASAGTRSAQQDLGVGKQPTGPDSGISLADADGEVGKVKDTSAEGFVTRYGEPDVADTLVCGDDGRNTSMGTKRRTPSSPTDDELAQSPLSKRHHGAKPGEHLYTVES